MPHALESFDRLGGSFGLARVPNSGFGADLDSHSKGLWWLWDFRMQDPIQGFLPSISTGPAGLL